MPGTVRAAETSEELVNSIDFCPTILEFAGLKKRPDNPLEGMSLTKHLKSGTRLDQQFFAARRVSEGTDATSTPVTVVPDARTNTLIVAASREGLEAAATMIKQLDVDHRGGYDARIFALKKRKMKTKN